MEKTLADVVNLKELIEETLRDYNIPENQRLEIASKIYERYRRLVQEIATKYLEYEASKRSTLNIFNNLEKK